MGLWDELEKWKSYHWVELSHTVDNDSPVWSGMGEGVMDLGKVIFDYEEHPDILKCRIQTFKFPGQFGTHIDFPVHFEPGLASSDEWGPYDLALPLVVVDISEKVAENPEYAVTMDDIYAHEEKYGTIPAGCFVALRTDWSKRWPDNDALNNYDDEGGEHAPGWSLEVIKFLYEERGIYASGHETIDTDASVEACAHEDLACERYVLANGHVQLELMDNLDKVPAIGAIIFVAWPRVADATGMPVRAWAVFD